MSVEIPDTVGMSAARDHLSHIVDRARTRHEPVYLENRGRRVAAVIDADDLDRLLELAEAMLDIRAVDQARAELDAGEAAVPLDELRADLGL